MSPPTEQLIRDYLNRLSVAARGQLGSDDRRALVARTREFIERKTALNGPPTAVEVGRLLSGLGDPAGLVSQERQRLATLRGKEIEPVSRGLLARLLRGDPAKVRGASWHWPVQPGSRADLQLTLIDGGVPAAGQVTTARATASREGARPVAAEADGQLAPSPAPSDDLGSSRPLWPALAAGTADDGPAPPQSSRARQLLANVAAWSRHHKLEAVAVALLGLGGVIFPPVWLLGAAVALASRLWDHRDKWVALALPVLLTVIGTAVGVAVGGQGSFGHGIHVGWVFAVDISRASAVLSACYLARRAARGPRPPAVPPWNRPHRVT